MRGAAIATLMARVVEMLVVVIWTHCKMCIRDRGGDTIDDSAVYWYSIGDDSLNHTYVTYINKKDST